MKKLQFVTRAPRTGPVEVRPGRSPPMLLNCGLRRRWVATSGLLATAVFVVGAVVVTVAVRLGERGRREREITGEMGE